MAEENRVKQRIMERLSREGFTVAEWRDSEQERPEAVLTGRFRVIEDADGDQAPYVDEEGIVVASVVGAEQYGNERVHFAFVSEEYVEGEEVQLENLEPI